MGKFEDFFADPPKVPVEPPEETRVNGAFRCQWCEETVPYAHLAMDGTLYWICSTEHRSKIPWLS